MLEFLFEDDLILAVRKPSGLPSQTQSRPDDPENRVQETAQSRMAGLRPDLSFHLLHRLDTGTSGVLLFAKSKEVFDEIRLKFKNREIKKFYRAWSGRVPTKTKTRIEEITGLPFEITIPLGHHPKSKKRMIPLPEGLKREHRGKPLPAISILHAMREIQIPGGLSGTEFEIEIKTGVMHQIRVHLSHLGFPILGDPIYASKLPEFPRLALHAERVEFEFRGFSYRIESNDPKFI